MSNRLTNEHGEEFLTSLHPGCCSCEIKAQELGFLQISSPADPRSEQTAAGTREFMSAPPKTLLGAGTAVSDGIFLPDVRPRLRHSRWCLKLKPREKNAERVSFVLERLLIFFHVLNFGDFLREPSIGFSPCRGKRGCFYWGYKS